jgi:hypothetical protein
MFDLDEMWERIPELIEQTSQFPGPIRSAMVPWFKFCRAVAPEQTELWDELESLNYDEDLLPLADWIRQLLTSEPPDSDINALWFGLHNPQFDDGEDSCQFYCAGSNKFDPDEPYDDWHCGPAYFPEQREARSQVMHTLYSKVNPLPGELSYLGECFLCHGYLAAILSAWCHNDMADLLLGPDRSRAIAMGHDSGDIYFVRQPGIS